MGRNKKPTALLEAKGSFLLHRDRARPNEPTSDRPLGPPPKWLNAEERKVWKQIAKQALPGVLKRSDRTQFALLVRLATKLYGNLEMKCSEMSLLVTLGSKFAMNPADRSRVVVEKPKESTLAAFMRQKARPAPGAAPEAVN